MSRGSKIPPIGPAWKLAAPPDGERIIIPDEKLLLSGEFKRSNDDLILGLNGKKVVVHGYFGVGKLAALKSPTGAILNGEERRTAREFSYPPSRRQARERHRLGYRYPRGWDDRSSQQRRFDLPGRRGSNRKHTLRPALGSLTELHSMFPPTLEQFQTTSPGSAVWIRQHRSRSKWRCPT